MLLGHKFEALQNALLQRREPHHLWGGDPVLPRNPAQLRCVRPRPPLELPSLIPPAVQETPTSSKRPDAEQHREGVCAIDCGQGRKPRERGEQSGASDRLPESFVPLTFLPLSDHIHYTLTFVITAPQ